MASWFRYIGIMHHIDDISVFHVKGVGCVRTSNFSALVKKCMMSPVNTHIFTAVSQNLPQWPVPFNCVVSNNTVLFLYCDSHVTGFSTG